MHRSERLVLIARAARPGEFSLQLAPVLNLLCSLLGSPGSVAVERAARRHSGYQQAVMQCSPPELSRGHS